MICMDVKTKEETRWKKAKVYFTDFRAGLNQNLLQKLEKLVVKAGIEQLDFQNKFAAIKIHFGEPGNLAYLRPNYAKVIVDLVRRNGGRPFLTDCNTLYVGAPQRMHWIIWMPPMKMATIPLLRAVMSLLQMA